MHYTSVYIIRSVSGSAHTYVPIVSFPDISVTDCGKGFLLLPWFTATAASEEENKI